MKKFNKITFLQSVGYLNANLDQETLRFKSSWKLRLKCHLIFLINVSAVLKMCIFALFEREDPRQLYIGSIFNVLTGTARLFIALVCVIIVLWVTALYIVFNHSNVQQHYRLYEKWAKLSGEMPEKSELDKRVPGILREASEQFWRLEDQFNYRCSRAIYIFLFAFNFVFSAMLFVVDLQIDLCTYLLFQTINIAHYTFFYLTFAPSLCLTGLFLLNLTRFFVKRFRYITRKVERLNAKTEPISNRKLARLLYDHNRIHLDLIEMNRFFRPLVGTNFVCICAVGLLVAFLLISGSIDWKVKLCMFTSTLAVYVTTIAIPFKFANFVTTAINRTRRELEKVAFKQSINLQTKQKIELISAMSEKAGFTCFSFFRLSSSHTLQAFLEQTVYQLLLIEAYYMGLWKFN